MPILCAFNAHTLCINCAYAHLIAIKGPNCTHLLHALGFEILPTFNADTVHRMLILYTMILYNILYIIRGIGITYLPTPPQWLASTVPPGGIPRGIGITYLPTPIVT